MKETQVKINAKVIDSNARDQIKLMADSPAFHGLISIMPDVHLGIGAVIGFTGKFNKCVIPNVVGVDIGCGVTAYPLGKVHINFEELDKHIRANVPLGFKSQADESFLKGLTPVYQNMLKKLSDKIVKEFFNNTYKDYKLPLLQFGTLGGGNHFIEVNVDNAGNQYVVVHSGSRNLGQKVAKWYQDKAVEFHKAVSGSNPTKHLEYLPDEYGGKDYLKALYLAQEYASFNRKTMIIKILEFFNLQYHDILKIESIHNYICPKDNVVRKGAISAHKGERVIIPLNMRDGIVLGTGKGNSSYNNSAPHGAGRVFGRNVMKQQLRDGVVTMESFKDEMKDVYSTSVCQGTIDESPFAYKSFEDIKEYLEETVEIERILKPIYNLKAN